MEVNLEPLLLAKDRPLFVGEDGDLLTRSGFNTSWQRLMKNSIADEVITVAERFAVHGLKHRGVTDTKGDKKLASGHRTDAMVHVYNRELAHVEPADDN
ncbi:hypothetical protein [Xanthomonas oryzae]|uniref:hypothetical protein n=1 Tax=Xanthomonas oryzae TaxID=347 RepID=UPI003DA174C3